jgi:hypothetical protein
MSSLAKSLVCVFWIASVARRPAKSPAGGLIGTELRPKLGMQTVLLRLDSTAKRTSGSLAPRVVDLAPLDVFSLLQRELLVVGSASEPWASAGRTLEVWSSATHVDLEIDRRRCPLAVAPLLAAVVWGAAAR